MSLWRSVRAAPSSTCATLKLDAVRDALSRAERLIEPELVPAPVLPPNVIVLRPAPPVVVKKAAIVLEEVPSAWDPEPETDVRLVANDEPSEPFVRDEAFIQQEINGAKTLLLEIIRRSAFDYVLYRTSRRLVYRALADQAYHWLFVEKQGTSEWAERQREGKFITGFEAICEALDLDPDAVRAHVRRLTPKHVTSVGRPAEYRRRDVFSNAGDDAAHAIPSGLIAEDDTSDETIY
jgi:hypothetical protein